MRGFVRSLGVRFESVDDVAQDVLLHAWRTLDEFQRPGDFGAWIKRIAMNYVANERRKSARRSRLISNEIAESLLSAVDREPGPLEVHQQRELAGAVRDCLSKLPRRGQDLLSLRYFEGLAPGAIASVTQQPSNRVRQSLLRWRRLLGDCIEKRLKLKVL